MSEHIINGQYKIYKRTISGTTYTPIEANDVQVEDDTSSTSKQNPVITTLSNGNYVIAWEFLDDIYAKIYDGSHNVVKSEFRVNFDANGVQRIPSIASLSGGNFVIAFESLAIDGSDSGIGAVRFDSSGNAL